MALTPYELVAFGLGGEPSGRDVTAPVAGPDLTMRYGVVALADPGSPDDLPRYQVSALGEGTSSTTSRLALPTTTTSSCSGLT